MVVRPRAHVAEVVLALGRQVREVPERGKVDAEPLASRAGAVGGHRSE